MATYSQRKFAARIAELTSEGEESIRAKLKRLKKQGALKPLEDNGERKGDVYDDNQIEEFIKLTSPKKSSRSDELSLFDTEQAITTSNSDTPTEPTLDVQKPAVDATERNTGVSNDTRADAQIITVETPPFEPPIISLDERANRIRQYLHGICQNVIAIGMELISAKEEIGHGGWRQWLDTEFTMAQQTANVYMRLAKRFGGKLNYVIQFQESTLKELLALPEGTEQQFIDAQTKAGKPLESQSVRQVKASVKDFLNREVKGEYVNITGKSSNDDVVDELNAKTPKPTSPSQPTLDAQKHATDDDRRPNVDADSPSADVVADATNQSPEANSFSFTGKYFTSARTLIEQSLKEKNIAELNAMRLELLELAAFINEQQTKTSGQL